MIDTSASSPTRTRQRSLNRKASKWVFFSAIATSSLLFTVYNMASDQTRFVFSLLPAGPRMPVLIKTSPYVVDGSGCKIVDFDPWDSNIRFVVKKTPTLRCNGADPPVRVEFDRVVVEKENVTCEYQAITRPSRGPDSTFNISAPVRFGREVRVNESAIKLTCYNSTNGTLLYIGAFPIVRENSTLQRQLEERKQEFLKTNSIRDRFNVILLFIDAVSRLNFMRQMSRTREYLVNKENVFEFRGYTKVGDNTFPNLIPLLTGRYVEEVTNETTAKIPQDYLPLIWKNYSVAGYETFLGEDSPEISTFNLKRGFRQQPTDHYLRPWTLAVEKLRLRSEEQSNCIGSLPEAYFYLHFLEELMRLRKSSKSLFGFVITNRISHDDINAIGGLDELYDGLFRRLFEDHLLDDTFLFFFSDHGYRYGYIRDFLIGKMEERLPFSFLVAPKRFLSEYPEMAANVRKNQGRLTTPFDVYATMAQLLHFDGKVANHSIKDRGISLFTEVPESRTCEDATILPHWCCCHEFVPVNITNPAVLQAAATMLAAVNQLILESEHSAQCAKLELQTVLNAHSMKTNQLLLYKQNRPTSVDDYTVTVEVTPGGGRFEGTVRFDEGKNKTGQVVGAISRTNLYGTASRCFDDSILKLYCYCK